MNREQLIEAAREFLQDADYSYRHVSSNRTLPEAIADFAAKQLERAESVISHYANGETWARAYEDTWCDDFYTPSAHGYDLARDYFAGERDGS